MVDITGLVSGFVGEIGNQIGHLPAEESIIFDIALILIISAVFAFIARMLKQPLIPAYVLAGLVVGPLVLGFVKNLEIIYAFSEIGIAFLLFTAGLEISFKKIKEANIKRIVLIGVFQVLFIFILAVLLRNWLGLTTLQASYIGIVLAFGSTMVDVKLLADRGELVTLHGRIILGILLLQDLIAILAIIVLTTGGFNIIPILMSLVKLISLIVGAIILQKYVLNKLFNFAARSGELLFLSALAVLFLFIITSYLLELSIVIGAFIAGVSLANSPFKTELGSKVSPLRDFFAILFFVALGMQIVFTGVKERMVLFWFLLIVGLIIKPIITFILLKTARYHTKTSFLTSISLAQLSEFSLIIGMLGVYLGVLDNSIFSTIILVTIITMAITPYLINFKSYIFHMFKYPFSFLRFLPAGEGMSYHSGNKKEIILIGAHRMGSVLLEGLMDKKDKLLVIDYNPEIISALTTKKISSIYGDISSPEVIQFINSSYGVKKIISTAPSFEDNLYLLKKVKQKNPHIKVIVTGGRISETNKFYEEGADYVITPKIVAGEEIISLLKADDKKLSGARRKHIARLKNLHKLLY
ncbi:MAG: cation:proton antiporter [Nanoarchaeota archaeon]|nr:cation:proton antiporter [Nanoarchaeota archaeon]